MSQSKPIREHDTTTAGCPQCGQRKVEVQLDHNGKIPDGVPWECHCGAMGVIDAFEDGTFVAAQLGGYKDTGK